MTELTDPTAFSDDYDHRPLTDNWNHPVLESEFTAWEVLLNFNAYETEGLFQTYLFVRGLEHYRDSEGVFDEDRFISDIEDFAIAASGGVEYDDVVADPWFDPKEPGRLAVLYGGSAFAMKYHSVYDMPPSKVDYDKYAAEALLANIYAAFEHHPKAGGLQRAAAEAVFGRKQPDEHGATPGRPITDICQLENGRYYFEMPLVHASRHALARDDDTDTIKSLIKNNCIYIPWDFIETEYEEYLLSDGRTGGVAYDLREEYRKMVPPENRENFLEITTRIGDQIKRIKQANRTQKLYKEDRYPEPLRCILKAVSEAPNEHATVDDWVTARDVLNAIEWFTDQVPTDTDADVPEDQRHSEIRGYEQHTLDDFNTPEGITTYLRDHRDHGDVEFQQRDHPEPNLFKLSYYSSDIKQIDVETPDDVFELPCVANLEEHFMQNEPVRRPLYFLVRIVASLENEFEPEEIYQIFQRFPWYKPEVTEYQVDYELREGDHILPVSCRNDNNPHWNQFCIGMENCDYSIWRSLPLDQEVYDEADSGR